MTIEIPLTQGFSTYIDDIDSDLTEFNWRISREGSLVYARRGSRIGQSNRKQKTVRMHRLILERVLGRTLAPHNFVDHIDHDTLNNRRGNLRLATSSQNAQNSKKPANNTSGFKGVTWNKRRELWQSQIQANGRRLYLGLYDTPEAAHEVYKAAALKYFGEYAHFGDDDSSDVEYIKGLPR